MIAHADNADREAAGGRDNFLKEYKSSRGDAVSAARCVPRRPPDVSSNTAKLQADSECALETSTSEVAAEVHSDQKNSPSKKGDTSEQVNENGQAGVERFKGKKYNGITQAYFTPRHARHKTNVEKKTYTEKSPSSAPRATHEVANSSQSPRMSRQKSEGGEYQGYPRTYRHPAAQRGFGDRGKKFPFSDSGKNDSWRLSRSQMESRKEGQSSTSLPNSEEGSSKPPRTTQDSDRSKHFSEGTETTKMITKESKLVVEKILKIDYGEEKKSLNSLSSDTKNQASTKKQSRENKDSAPLEAETPSTNEKKNQTVPNIPGTQSPSKCETSEHQQGDKMEFPSIDIRPKSRQNSGSLHTKNINRAPQGSGIRTTVRTSAPKEVNSEIKFGLSEKSDDKIQTPARNEEAIPEGNVMNCNNSYEDQGNVSEGKDQRSGSEGVSANSNEEGTKLNCSAPAYVPCYSVIEEGSVYHQMQCPIPPSTLIFNSNEQPPLDMSQNFYQRRVDLEVGADVQEVPEISPYEKKNPEIMGYRGSCDTENVSGSFNGFGYNPRACCKCTMPHTEKYNSLGSQNSAYYFVPQIPHKDYVAPFMDRMFEGKPPQQRYPANVAIVNPKNSLNNTEGTPLVEQPTDRVKYTRLSGFSIVYHYSFLQNSDTGEVVVKVASAPQARPNNLYPGNISPSFRSKFRSPIGLRTSTKLQEIPHRRVRRSSENGLDNDLNCSYLVNRDKRIYAQEAQSPKVNNNVHDLEANFNYWNWKDNSINAPKSEYLRVSDDVKAGIEMQKMKVHNGYPEPLSASNLEIQFLEMRGGDVCDKSILTTPKIFCGNMEPAHIAGLENTVQVDMLTPPRSSTAILNRKINLHSSELKTEGSKKLESNEDINSQLSDLPESCSNALHEKKNDKDDSKQELIKESAEEPQKIPDSTNLVDLAQSPANRYSGKSNSVHSQCSDTIRGRGGSQSNRNRVRRKPEGDPSAGPRKVYNKSRVPLNSSADSWRCT